LYYSEMPEVIKKLIKYIILVVVISVPLFLWEKKIMDSTDSACELETKRQLSTDAKKLISQFEENIHRLISDARLLFVSPENPENSHLLIKNFLDRNSYLSSIRFFTADGALKYSSGKNKMEWKTNFLNRPWYRELIKTWQPVISGVYQSPISPFPEILALAVPVAEGKKLPVFGLCI